MIRAIGRHCIFDQTDWFVKDQLIKGINNCNLQADMIAKAKTFQTLQDVVQYASAFEAALKDQSAVSELPSVARFSPDAK